MSTDTLPKLRGGYFPHWKLKTTGVIMPEERLPWGQTIVSGMQHGVAMAGGTIIAPLIMGFDPNRALLSAAERLITEGRLPVPGSDELGTIKKLSSGQEGPSKIGAVEHRFEEVRTIQVGAGQVRLG